jgi:hypothetical protein
MAWTEGAPNIGVSCRCLLPDGRPWGAYIETVLRSSLSQVVRGASLPLDRLSPLAALAHGLDEVDDYEAVLAVAHIDSSSLLLYMGLALGLPAPRSRCPSPSPRTGILKAPVKPTESPPNPRRKRPLFAMHPRPGTPGRWDTPDVPFGALPTVDGTGLRIARSALQVPT